jgi:hypothetical protein
MASITMKWRLVQQVPEQTFGAYAPEQEHFAMVPICLHCWLVDLERPPDLYRPLRGESPWRQDEAAPRLSSIINEVRRLRCEGCRRPMRIEVRWRHRIARRERCCCEECFRVANRRANNLRRRVAPKAKRCVVCSTMFMPRKSNATTCSGKCRVKKMRHGQSEDAVTKRDTVERAIEAVATGHGHRRCFAELSQEECWREFFVRVAELPRVDPQAQMGFLTWWAQLGWAVRTFQIKDDAVLLAGLWKLLPPYDGPPVDLWRG